VDINSFSCVKDASAKFIVDQNGIKDTRKQYMEKLVNLENECNHETSCTLKQGPAACISIAEVIVALKQM